MMFKIFISIGLLASYSIAKSVDLPNETHDLTKDGSALQDSVPDLSEVIREVENIQETFLRKLSDEMKKIDGKLQKIRSRHEEEMKKFGQQPTHEVPVLDGEKMPEQESDLPTDSDQSEEDLRRGGKKVEPNLTETPQSVEKIENLPNDTLEVLEPELTKSDEKEPIEEFGEDFGSTTPKSLEQIVEDVNEALEELKTQDNLKNIESDEEKGEQESKEKQEPVEKEKKMDVSSSESSSESSEEKSDLITAPSGSSIIISVPVELQEEGKVNIEVIPGEGKEFLNPENLRLSKTEYSTEAPRITTTEAPAEILTDVPAEETTTETPSTAGEEESSILRSTWLPTGNTVVVSLSTGPPQFEEKKTVVIDIEIPKGPTSDKNLSSKTIPTEGGLPEPTTADRASSPTKPPRRPTEGKKRPSGKRCPIGYQLNIYTLECTAQTNYATGFGSYYWSMSQPLTSLTQNNNPFMNLFGMRK